MFRALRIVLAAGLILGGPGTGWTQTVARALPAGGQVFALPVSAASPALGGLSTPFPLPAPVLTKSAAPMTVAAPLTLPSAAVASPLAGVERHPIVDLVNKLQAQGIALPETADGPVDAAKLRQAAAALPEGGVRESLLRLAGVAAAPPGLARQFALHQLFENGVLPAVPMKDPAPRAWFWERVAKSGLVPAPIRRIADERAKSQAPKPQPASADNYKVKIERLRWVPDAAMLEQAKQLPAIDKQIVGQDLALEALRFGLRMEGNGHNVIVTGPDGSGRQTAVKRVLQDVAPGMPTPKDLVSVTNFENKERPLVLEVPSGFGPALEKGVAAVLKALQQALPATLNGGRAAAEKKQIHDEFMAQNSEREAQFKAAVAELRLADGKFGVAAEPQRGEEGRVALMIAPTFEGKMVPIGSEKELIDAGRFTQAEWDKARAELQAVGRQILTQYVHLAEQTQQEFLASRAEMAKIDAAAASEVVSAIGGELRTLAVVPAKHEDAAHAALDQRAKQLLAEYKQTNGSRQIGPFFAVIRMAQTQMGPMPVPQLNLDGQPITKEALMEMLQSGRLSPEEWKRLQGEIKQFAMDYSRGLAQLSQQLEAEHQAIHANDPAPTESEQETLGWIDQLLAKIASSYEEFLPQEEPQGGNPLARMLAARKSGPSEAFRVKVLSTNEAGTGAPVIFEHSPTFENLMGSLVDSERVMMVPGAGMMKADSAGGPELKAGSFIRANGGFLVLDLMDVLREPGAWQALMRAVRTGQAEIAEGGVSGVLLGRSEKRYPVKAKVKVVLIGSPALKAMLAENDPDFAAHFKAESQFESAMDIAVESLAGYVQFIRKQSADTTSSILNLTHDAIVEVLQYGSRLAGSNEKLSTKFKPVLDLLAEASYWAREAGRTTVTGQDVSTAIKKRWDFEGRMRRRMQESYWKDVFHVQTEGTAIGQINALTVYGGEFGVPTRATVVVEAGKNGVTGLDRNAGWAGSSYVKGLETLKSFTAYEFGQDKPLPFDIRVSKEQLYGGIDGDSSTSTNIYASLSALSRVPIKQTIAITGSSDQFGNVQAIGGVNQKIEGFFDVLTAKLKAAGKELDGTHGVIIPATNIPDLNLRQDVVDAIKAGKFHVWGVTDVRQGIEILTGTAYPEIKRLIEERADAVRKGKKTGAE
ncbi:MAG: AAA family ATPase [Elusimicrobia bacterium]|nr:AAA family ATPase [Elusimicrobiota bacterium]